MKLNYEKRGSGPAILFGHGFPFDHTMWRAQLEGLSNDFTVIAPDFRGMGQSPASGEKVTTMGDLADDLNALLDQLGIEKCAYCGLSMGGYVGLEFWYRYTDRLEALILCDTNARCDSPEGAAKRLVTAEKLEMEKTCAFMVDGMKQNLMTPATLADAKNPQGVFAAYKKMVTENNPLGVASVARGMAQRRDFSEMAQEIFVPTLVLTGELDVLSPPSAMKSLAEKIPGADFVSIPNAAHLAPMEQPEQLNFEIQKFLTVLNLTSLLDILGIFDNFDNE